MDDRKQESELVAQYVNLADARLGATVLSASDEFFGAKERLLNAAEPEWRAGVYDDHGKWMDGWESRRRRDQGFDHCIIQLAAPCTLAALDIDTRFFTGNFPPHASVEVCRIAGKPDTMTQWSALLPYVPLQGDAHNLFRLSDTSIVTHLKLNIHPDGGIARLRAYGSVHQDWTRRSATEVIDLVAALNGGRALICSDEHYGSMGNLLLPGLGATMQDGWETRRRREPGFDWAVLRLGHPGIIQHVELDTSHFKGNFPHQVSIHAAMLPTEAGSDLGSECMYWPVLLPPQLLQADSMHSYRSELRDIGAVSHVRVNMHPDGGLNRVHLFGRIG